VKSLQYSFVIAILYPLAPSVFVLIADRLERKWQVVIASASVRFFGLAFSQQSRLPRLVGFGGLLATSNLLLSYSYHAYQSELYPTRVRGPRNWILFIRSGRCPPVFSSFMIAFFLQRFGTVGVFSFIAFAMLVVVLSVSILGAQTSGALWRKLRNDS